MSDNVRIPKLIATSVIRGSEKGQSHGGVYLIDFERQSVEQKIDWNSGDIDFPVVAGIAGFGGLN